MGLYAGKKRAKQEFSCQGRQKYVASALIASNVDGSDAHFRALCFFFVMPFSSAASADPLFWTTCCFMFFFFENREQDAPNGC